MKRIEADTFLQYKYLSSPRFSPDGKTTAFLVKQADLAKDGYKSDVYLLDENNNVERITSSEDVSFFSWENDGKLLFASTRSEDIKKRKAMGERLTSFYELSSSSREAVSAFTLPLVVEGIEQMSSGKFAVQALFDRRYPDLENLNEAEKASALRKYTHPSYRTFTELPFWGNGAGILHGIVRRLFIYDRNNDTLTPVTDPNFDVVLWDVSRGRLVYKGSFYDNERNSKSAMYVYDEDKNESIKLLDQGLYKTERFGLLDDNTFVCSICDHEGYNTNESYGNLYKIDIKTKERTLLCKYERTIGGCSIGSDSRLGGGITFKVDGDKVYFVTTVDESAYIRSVDKNGKLEDVYAELGTADCFDVKDGKLVIKGMYGNLLGELYNEKGQRLTHFNDEVSAEYSVSTPVMHTFKAKDGWEVRGFAMKPVGYEEGKKYPCILNIHGGPRTAFGSVFYNEMQLWANHGYFVIYCNPLGSCGRGDDFGYLMGKYGESDYNHIMEFTDEMIKVYPDIDEDRMGVAGGSYGGYMTNWVIGHTNRFKAAASQRSISSWLTMQYMSDVGYFDVEDQMETNAWTDAKELWDRSPIKYIADVKTPTLFIHSQEDYRCPRVEGLSMFSGMRQHNVPAKLCLFEGENHELSRSGKPSNRISRMEEILSWMDKYLKK